MTHSISYLSWLFFFFFSLNGYVDSWNTSNKFCKRGIINIRWREVWKGTERLLKTAGSRSLNLFKLYTVTLNDIKITIIIIITIITNAHLRLILIMCIDIVRFVIFYTKNCHTNMGFFLSTYTSYYIYKIHPVLENNSFRIYYNRAIIIDKLVTNN